MGLAFNLHMINPTTDEVVKRLIQRLDVNFLSYAGYPPDETVPYPEEFARGYHKCIEDLINEAQRIGFATAVSSDTTPGES
jgi:hypothetical protein